jgi:hypothetical protein
MTKPAFDQTAETVREASRVAPRAEQYAPTEVVHKVPASVRAPARAQTVPAPVFEEATYDDEVTETEYIDETEGGSATAFELKPLGARVVREVIALSDGRNHDTVETVPMLKKVPVSKK